MLTGHAPLLPPALQSHHNLHRSGLRALELVIVDGDLQVNGLAAVDAAADGVASAEHLLDSSLELLGQALMPHLPDDVEELLLRQIPAVLDVLGLLAVTQRLLELLNDEAGSIRLHVNLRGAVLDRQPDSHADTLPLAHALDNIVADLLRRHTQWTDLRCQH